MFIAIYQVFLAFLTKLEELNNFTAEPIFIPSAIHSLQGMVSQFEVPNGKQLRSIENNPDLCLSCRREVCVETTGERR